MRGLSVLLAAFLGLGGCSLSGVIGHSTVDYNQTVEYATNNMLITNFLRARDEVPLYFTELSQIRGSLQLSTSAAITAPFGNADIANQRTRNIASGIISISTSPTFDIAPLNDTIFTEGLLKPINPTLLGDYLAQGVPQGLLLRLLVDRIEFVSIPEETAKSEIVVCGYENTPYANVINPSAAAPAGGSSPPSPCPPHGFEGINTFDQLLGLSPPPKNTPLPSSPLPLIVHSYTRLTPFGPPFRVEGPMHPGELLRVGSPSCCGGGSGGAQSGDQTKQSGDQTRQTGGEGGSSLTVRPVRGKPGEYQLYRSRSEVAVCIPAIIHGLKWEYLTSGDAPEAACFADQVVQSEEHRPPWRVNIYFRSAQGIFEYLGDILRIEKMNEVHALPPGLNFYVKPEYDAAARVNLTYNGALYHVDESSSSDSTLRVTAVVNQLLNTLKSASEIPSTQAVEAVP